MQRTTCKDIFGLFAFDLLIGGILWLALHGLGIAPQLLWWLLSLCMVLLPLAGAFVRRSWIAFFLTCSLALAAAVLGVAFHFFLLFVGAYIALLLLSLLIAFTAAVQGY